MKKIVATILIAILAITCLMSFVGCNNNDEEYGDTFVGAISQSTYDSVEDAVKGFLEEEISGMAFTAQYVGYTKTSDLSQHEISELAIDEGLKDGIVSVEKGEVEYIEKEGSMDNELLTKLAVETSKREVYIVTYKQNGETKYRFYTPSVEVGQCPSASAWASIIQYSKYYNSTININYSKEGQSLTSTWMFSQEAIYTNTVEDSITGRSGYFINYNNDLFTVIEDSDTVKGWSINEIDAYDYDDEKITMSYWADSQLFYILLWQCALYQHSHGYFIKTDTGYKSRGKFIRDEDVYEYSILDNYEIKIANERISEISFNIVESHYTYPKDEIVASGIDVKVTFSDFGTTKVDMPKDAMDALKAYTANR